MSLQWGNWRFDAKHFVVAHRTSGYWIDLASCTTSAQVLDWITQVRGKTWSKAQDVIDLIEALDDILGLQANICSNGRSKKISPRQTATARGYVLS
jgi:hypothetical protein